MAEKTLGPEFLIHGGGLDLVFPHHENERAQSQAVGRPFARIWMHNGLLRFTGEKMSKSVGNVATIQEVIAGVGAGGGAAVPDDRSLAQAARVLGGGDDGRARPGREPAQRASRRDAVGGRLGRARSRARRRLQHPGRARDLAPLGARGRARPSCGGGSPIFGLESSPTPSRLRRSSWRWPARAPRPERRATSPSRTACATRSRPPAGKCGTQRAPDGFELVPLR